MKRSRNRTRPQPNHGRKIKIVLPMALLLVALGFAAYLLRPQDPDRYITEPPTNAAALHEEAPELSTYTLDIPTPLSHPDKEADEFKLDPIKGLADGPRECSNQRGIRNSCYTTKYEYSITFASAAINQGANGDLSITVPVFVSGKGSQKGRAQDRPQSDIRYFQSKLTANANISVSVDSRWCPRIDIKPDFTWKDPTRVEIFNRKKVDIQYFTEKMLSRPITELASAYMQNFIGCDKVRGVLMSAWKYNSLAISNADGKTLQYVNIKPQNIGYTGLKLISDKLYIEFRLSAYTDLSNQAASSTPRQLPELTHISKGEGSASIPLPISLTYQHILSAINNQIARKPFQTKNRWGAFTISIKKIKIYPSDDELILGLQLHMTNSDSWTDTYGWVYLATTPKLAESGDGIDLTEPVFSKPVNISEWSELKRALNETIIETIEQQGLTVSFTKDSKHLLENIQNELQKTQPGSIVRFEQPAFRINNISLLSSGILINGLIQSKASFVTDDNFEQLAVADVPALEPTPKPASSDASSDEIQLKINNLLNQMDGIESRLKQFRQILSN